MKEHRPRAMRNPIDVIAAVPREVGRRPFWSVMIPTYNRSTYLERTLASVLSQDPGPAEMQIEVVDDASTADDPEPLVRRIGGGRVGFFRQPQHLGTSASFTSCVERSMGLWVHILNSDDVVLPGFYERFKAALEKRDDVGAAFCRFAIMDENERRFWTSEMERTTPGIIADFVCKIGFVQMIASPSIVVRRSVYEQLGGFRKDLSCATDWEMDIRIAAHYPFWYEPEVMAAWRDHSNSSTASFTKTGGNVADSRHCVEVSRRFLPPDHADRISRAARERLALEALRTVLGPLANGDYTMARRQICEGLMCSVSPRVIKALLLLLLQVAGAVVRRGYKVCKSRFVRGGS